MGLLGLGCAAINEFYKTGNIYCDCSAQELQEFGIIYGYTVYVADWDKNIPTMVSDGLTLAHAMQGLIVGCMLSSAEAPSGWPKWLWYTGVIGRSHYNSRGRGFCSLASLYG